MNQSAIYYTPDQQVNATDVAITLNVTDPTFANTILAEHNSAPIGHQNWLQSFGTWLADPVNPITGEFYIDAVDLTIPGVTPMQVRRNYLSQNRSKGQFGAGWKLSYTPHLVLTTNAQSVAFIYAAEPDGSVLLYRETNSLWRPLPQDNPTLNNYNSAGIGSLANMFNAQIVVTNGTNYALTAGDGSVRHYETRSYPIVTTSNTLYRTRPYLVDWRDTRGNTYSFFYGTNGSSVDFGELVRVESSNGSYLGFAYDAYNRVIEAWTADGRRVNYDYDQYGDLVAVTLPDMSQVAYEYQHYTFTNGSPVQTNWDSRHLMVRELKPDGRALLNEYDDQKRVTNQWATVGPDLRLVRNATFLYSNTFNLTNMPTNGVSGYVVVKDVFNNTNRYDYTNGLITRITDALNQTIIQDWYEPSETNKAGYYPRSLESRTDVRGLVTQFKYDAKGNVTNTVTTGDLTGDGTTQSATNIFTYDTRNLPTLATDPVGNQAQVLYDTNYPFLPQQTIHLAGGSAISTNFFEYYNVTNTVTNGTAIFTNKAFGLWRRLVRAYNSPDAATNDWTCDGRGFVTAGIAFTGTADPSVTNTFFFNNRNELSERTDGAGRKMRFDYDAMGRPKLREVYEAGQTVPVSWEYAYYSENGELTWSDGPRFDPEDYVWRDYDGAGRQTTEIRWRSRAKADGTGVEAETGGALYATTFGEYDAFGNLKRTIDPRGASTTNTWDALGRLTQRKFYDVDGATLLSSDGFAYEPGGKVRYYTNGLGGVTETQYTTNGLPKFRKNADGSTNGWRYYLDGRPATNFLGNGSYWRTIYGDATRQATNILYSSTGVALATNSAELDRRGNLVKRIDAGGNVFTNLYDGLDRLKVAAGPPVVTVNLSWDFATYITNVVQHASTNFYDAAGLVLTNVNALGEKAITFRDSLGRPTRTEVRTVAGVLVREKSAGYSSDHHSVTVTNSSGTNAIISTIYTDNDGQPVLSIAYPFANAREFTEQAYDPVGNLVFAGRYSATNATTTLWSQETHTYDGLNRLRTTVDRDNASTSFDYDPLNNLTNRTMPGGLRWRAEYSAAGQLQKSYNLAPDNTGTRTNTYTYYAANTVFASLPQTHTDGRGVVCTTTYDDFLRPITNNYAGALSEHNLTTVWNYDVLGFATNITESFTNPSTGPTSMVLRSYDPYGLLTSESVSLNGVERSKASLMWDSAGRRSRLDIGSFRYGYVLRADGLLGAVSAGPASTIATVSGSYGYSTAGLLTNRNVNTLAVSASSRDGAGRVLARTSKVILATELGETLAWTGDGLLAAHTLVRLSDYTDTRTYDYADASRRLAVERLKLDGTKGWTNNFSYDEGVAGGAGVLTKVAEPQTNGSAWTASLDAFDRVERETNNVIRRMAYGRMNATNGQATVSVALDGRPLPLNLFGTSDAYWPVQWRTVMELRPGTHTLQATANHSSGQFTTNTSATFTNNAVDQTTLSHFAEGELSYRVWRNSAGQTNRVQSFTWDARSRLIATSELDASNNGYNLSAVYDALGRRLQTITVIVTNGTSLTAQPKTISQFFDPSVEFLELGVKIEGKMTWKVYGPDLNGVYGGMNGTGGLDGLVDDFGLFRPVISDARGNVHGKYDTSKTTMLWNDSRPSGYGAVPEYRPVALADNGDIAVASAWRGRWPDLSGFYWLGARYYDPVSGSFTSCDPLGHDADASLYGFCGGNPIDPFDADGRLAKQAWDKTLYGGEIALKTLGGMANDIDTMRAAMDPNHPRHWEVTTMMGIQGAIDYANGGEGWSGGRNAFNRYNPVRAPFEAVSGMHMMEGPQLGNSLTWDESAVAWANTVSLAASLGAGAPGTVSAVSADLRALTTANNGIRVVNVGGPLDGVVTSRSLQPDYLNVQLNPPPSGTPYPATVAGDFNAIDLPAAAGNQVRTIKASNVPFVPTDAGYVAPAAMAGQAAAVGAARIVVSTGPQSVGPLVDMLRSAGWSTQIRYIGGRLVVTASK